ncbi:hypothetical protein [Arthrobacter sp. A2-55]|uniref:hypothetical protein n=1 Tax=Arthrobacter sp. A2-55 TaxID=2897337 RepID=UPI0021CD1F5E|nr:hypothetical protein [Arthrobacter sp. A2-55]MCU6480167.1 hypothetical protein [Arthrobacter sp. A2-55]
MGTFPIPSGPAGRIDDHFEEQFGAALAKEVTARQAIPTVDAIAASRLSDILRESHGEYYQSGVAELTPEEAAEQLRHELSALTDDRFNHWARRLGFAVHQEMKAWENPVHILAYQYDWELLIDLADYASDDPTEATDANREAWERVADTLAHHAALENALAQLPLAA